MNFGGLGNIIEVFQPNLLIFDQFSPISRVIFKSRRAGVRLFKQEGFFALWYIIDSGVAWMWNFQSFVRCGCLKLAQWAWLQQIKVDRRVMISAIPGIWDVIRRDVLRQLSQSWRVIYCCYDDTVWQLVWWLPAMLCHTCCLQWLTQKTQLINCLVIIDIVCSF